MPTIDQNSRRRRPTGLLALDETAAYDGHTLYAPLTGSGEVYLVDLRGETVHRWDLPYRPGRHARLLTDGTLAYNGVLPGEDALFPMWHKYRGGVMLHAAPDGTVLREHRDPLQHHDAHHLDDGRILYTGLEPLRGADAEAVRGGVPGSEADGGTVWADTIREIGPDGELLWSWNASEHLDRDAYPLHEAYAREHWPLINSVTPLRDGNVLASLRSVSAVVVISRETGEILWRSAPGATSQQHAPSASTTAAPSTSPPRDPSSPSPTSAATTAAGSPRGSCPTPSPATTARRSSHPRHRPAGDADAEGARPGTPSARPVPGGGDASRRPPQDTRSAASATARPGMPSAFSCAGVARWRLLLSW